MCAVYYFTKERDERDTEERGKCEETGEETGRSREREGQEDLHV